MVGRQYVHAKNAMPNTIAVIIGNILVKYSDEKFRMDFADCLWQLYIQMTEVASIIRERVVLLSREGDALQ